MHLLKVILSSLIYFTLAVSSSVVLNKFIGKFDKNSADNTSTIKLLFEIYMNIIILVIIAYLIDKLVNYFYDKISFVSTNSLETKEIDNSLLYSYRIIFGFSLFFYQHNLRDRISYLIHRIFPNYV